MIQSLVYPDLIIPNVNRILTNLIYFDFIGSWNLSWRADEQYTQDEMADEIVSVTGDLAIWRYRPNQIIIRYGFLGFDFLSSEWGTQTENKTIFKINLNCGIFWPNLIRDQIWSVIYIRYLTSIFEAYSHSHVISWHTPCR
jgi:hypothetical protein